MNFVPISVECLTCGSRLKVTDPALIGSIANCPKCNSMVQVQPPEPPPAQVAIGNANVDSEALTEDSIDVGDEGLDQDQLPSGFAGEIESPESEVAPAGPIPPNWQSEKAQRSRQIGLIVAISASTLLGAVLFFGWFVKSWNQKADTETKPAGLVATESLNPKVDEEAESSKTPTEAEPNVPEALAETDTAPTDVESKIDDLPVAEAVPEQPSDATEIVAETPKDDLPSDLIPKMDDIFAPADQKVAGAEDDDASTLERLPEGLRKIAGGFELEAEPTAPVLEPLRTEIKIEGPAVEKADPMMIANPPEQPNMRRALGVQFALSTKKDQVSLGDLMLIISQITAVPIQIDWVSFDLMGVDIRQGVRAPTRKVLTAEKFLNDVAASIGAEIQQKELMLVLTPTKATRDAAFANLFDLSDFADSDSAGAVLNEFLWGKDVAGQTKLKVGESQPEQELAGLATEALRRMRGVKTKVDEIAFRRWAQSTSDPVVDWPLVSAGVVGDQLDAPIAMSGFLRRIANRNGATCYVNWFDGIVHRMSPDQLTMPYSNTDAGAVLKSVLDPFKMQARRIDGQHWWVGNQSTYDRFPVVVWTEPLGPNPAESLKAIAAMVLKSEKNISHVAIDKVTGRAMMLLPRYIVRQMPKIQNGLNLTATQKP